MIEYPEFLQNERKFMHDIATPLMIASGAVELIMEKKNDPELKEDLERAQRALDKITSLLKEHRAQVIEIQAQLDNSK